jgi:predicted amidohydrolase YtcJ
LPGVELDAAGRPNGRLLRLDDWMRAQLESAGAATLPSLAGVSRLLASFGVTGVTDTTPYNGPAAMASFTSAVAGGELLQSVRVMGGANLPEPDGMQLRRGERKVLLDEHALPDWDTLAETFASAHRQGRAVAVHCVTPAELVLALSVLRAVGPVVGDRIEHASLVPGEVLPLLQEVGVRVVTQPGFVHERGDQYLSDVDAAQHDDLYRCRAFLAAGIPVAGSTDAPYGDPDPWAAMRAAVARTSRSGTVLGRDERVAPEQALALFTGVAHAPGGASREIAVGAPADLCLLDRPWDEARHRLQSEDVRVTIRAGQLIYNRDRAAGKKRDVEFAA